jgi:hypothetical protein
VFAADVLAERESAKSTSSTFRTSPTGLYYSNT